MRGTMTSPWKEPSLPSNQPKPKRAPLKRSKKKRVAARRQVNVHTDARLGNANGNVLTPFQNKTPLIVNAGQQTRDAVDGAVAHHSGTRDLAPTVRIDNFYLFPPYRHFTAQCFDGAEYGFAVEVPTLP